jgi:Tfp pilus assembly protein PilX
MRAKHTDNKKRGAILGVVLIVMLVVTTFGSGLVALNQASSVEVSKAISATQAFWAAEAGLERIKAIIAKSPVTALESIDAFDRNGLFAGQIDGQDYSVKYTAYAGTNGSYKITSTGTSRGSVVRQVAMDAWLQSVSKYLEGWNLAGKAAGFPCRFHDGDKLDGDGMGEAHFNGPLSIDGYPLFQVPVVLTGDRLSFTHLHRTEDDGAVFLEGIVFNESPLNFLDPGDSGYVDFMGDVDSASDAGGLSLDGDYEITFHGNGTLTYQAVNKKGTLTGPLVSYDLSTGNGAVYVDGDVYVSGEVRGKVTLAASSDLTIKGDITYASATTGNHSDVGFDKMAITDVLGLIAGDSVVFSKELSEINIHASIIVTEGIFGRSGPTGAFTGAINLFGGVIRYLGGGNHPQWAGVKNYLYDGRLLTSPPPYFPYSGYEYKGWRQAR